MSTKKVVVAKKSWTIKDTLLVRGSTYGSFNDNAHIAQRLKRVIAERARLVGNYQDEFP